MKQPERDDLLTRLDERTSNIWRSVEQIERHQAEQNGFIRDNSVQVKSNRVWITVFKWAGGATIVSGLGFVGWVAERLINGG